MQRIQIAHSPDSDDAFMFYGLATGKVEAHGFSFEHVLSDIETLNKKALEGTYEVTAISIHAYPYLCDRYQLLNCGASMGEGYGPILISRTPLQPAELGGVEVAVPGERTSALLALRLRFPDIRYRVMPFDEIQQAVGDGRVETGLLIHEGQLSFREDGLHPVIDLGQWWQDETGMPLPLGGNVIRRDLGPDTIAELSRLVYESIRHALDHREAALEYALQFGSGLSAQQGDQFVSMYVNERTLDYGDDGRRSVQLFLDRGFEAGLIPSQVKVDFVPGER